MAEMQVLLNDSANEPRRTGDLKELRDLLLKPSDSAMAHLDWQLDVLSTFQIQDSFESFDAEAILRPIGPMGADVGTGEPEETKRDTAGGYPNGGITSPVTQSPIRQLRTQPPSSVMKRQEPDGVDLALYYSDFRESPT